VEFRHLRYFVAVATQGSFVRAAEHLAIAQPALSRQIRDLEQEIGVDLFERDKRSVKLTLAGQACVRVAQQLLRDADQALERARQSSAGVVGRCVLYAGTLTLWNGIVARLVQRISRDYPGIDLVIVEQSLRKQWDALRTFVADIGLGIAVPGEYVELASEMGPGEMWDAALLPATHPLAGRASLSLAELRDECFVHVESDLVEEMSRLVRAEFARRSFVPTREREASTIEAVYLLVAAGQGWTFASRSHASHTPAGTVLVPLDDLKLLVRSGWHWRRGDQRAVVRTVLDVVRRVANETRPHPAGTPASGTRSVLAVSAACAPLRVELRHLRYFVAVVEEGSFGRAGERLQLTQPALSRQIRDLERYASTKLLDRESRGVVPTPAGETLYRDAQHLLADAERFVSEAQRARRGMLGDCVMGTVTTSIVRRLIARTLRDAALKFPEVEIVIEEMPTPIQAAAVRDGRVDIGICHSYPTVTIADRSIRRERLVDDAMDTALLSPNHPLAERRAIELTDLSDTPFLFMPRTFDPGFYDFVFASFAQHGYRPVIEGEWEGLRTVWSLAAQGKGWCLGSRLLRLDPPHGVVPIPIANFALPWGVDVLHRPDETLASVHVILDVVRAATREIMSATSLPLGRAAGGR
jgi:DNA-binding transcriptional LysR family regulator